MSTSSSSCFSQAEHGAWRLKIAWMLGGKSSGLAGSMVRRMGFRFCYSGHPARRVEEYKLRIAFLRHGPTDWNEEGRIQGRIDMPLSAAGRSKMAGLLPPAGFERARAFTSPLARARETAALLGFPGAVPDARLAEHNWGEWEGLTRD